MYTILHNSRCGKSRDAIKVLEESNVVFEVREYLKDELSLDELKTIVTKLNVSPIDIVRTNETIWKENFKGNSYTDDELIKIMIDNPKLIQRPIVFNSNEAVVGRPLENLINFIKK